MTNKEVKSEAIRRMRGSWGNCICITLFAFAFLCLFAIAETLIYHILSLMGLEYEFSAQYMLTTGMGRVMTALRVILLFSVIAPEVYVARRIFLDISSKRDLTVSANYMNSNPDRIFPRAIVTALVTSMLKFFAAAPLAAGIYGIYYWGLGDHIADITFFGLLCFMFSLGFTFVWTAVFIHYCISLSMTQYIMVLNPRANIFDACDLSVKLMEGKHSRYLSFLFSFVKFLPLLIPVFPAVIILPYFTVSYIVFMEDLMGDYWQDKLPAMIHRWEKYAK